MLHVFFCFSNVKPFLWDFRPAIYSPPPPHYFSYSLGDDPSFKTFAFLLKAVSPHLKYMISRNVMLYSCKSHLISTLPSSLSPLLPMRSLFDLYHCTGAVTKIRTYTRPLSPPPPPRAHTHTHLTCILSAFCEYFYTHLLFVEAPL